jgi:1-aminocyclopropane-1-carboxylate synthase
MSLTTTTTTTTPFSFLKHHHHHRYSSSSSKLIRTMSINNIEEFVMKSSAIGGGDVLSKRGYGACKPPFSYWPYFLRCAERPFDEDGDKEGFINLAVAQNFLAKQMVQDKLKLICSKESHLEEEEEEGNSRSPIFGLEAAGYDNMKGTKRLRQAFKNHANRTISPNFTWDEDDVCVSSGVGACIDNLVFAIADENDFILIPAPYYPAFTNDLGVRCKVRAIPVYAADVTMLPSIEDFENAERKAVDDGGKCRALLLTNPNNPLGIIYQPSDYKKAVHWALDREIHCISDEVYAGSIYDPEMGANSRNFESAAEMVDEHTSFGPHILTGLSKDFCASGYRVGVILTKSKPIQTALSNVSYFCAVPGPFQHMISAMLEDYEWVDELFLTNRLRLKQSRDVLVQRLSEKNIPHIVPNAGLFIWVDLSKHLKQDTWDEEKKLWKIIFDETHLLLTPGKDAKNASPGHFRLCFAATPFASLKVAIDRISEGLNRYHQS